MMTDARAIAVVERHGKLKGNRGIWESHWQEIADRVLPRMASFTTTLTPGRKKTDRIFDATAPLALDRYASAVESLICPRNDIWHGLEPAADHLLDDPQCKLYCEALTKLLFRYRYMPSANFGSQAHECIIQLGAFGTTGMLVDDAASYPAMSRSPSPIVYRSQPLTATYIDENASGQIDTVLREFTLTGRQAVGEFREKTPARIREAAERGDMRPWTFIHSSTPTDDVGPWSWDAPAGARFSSCVVSTDEKVCVREGYYTANPFAVSRNVVATGEIYGRSPAMVVLPDIKTLNELTKTYLRAVHKAVSPALLLADDGLGGALDLTPDALNYGHVSSDGRPLVMGLNSGTRPEEAQVLRQDLRSSINDAFLNTLFLILVENKEMTAYEAALRAQEKGQLLAPTMGRQETEFLAPIIEREMDILWKRGVISRELPPMPDKLRAIGGMLKVVYTSPLSRLAMSAQIVAIQSWVSDIAPIAQINPGVMDKVDFDAAADVLADARGVPQKIRRDADQIAAIRAKRQQDQNAQQLLEAAPVAAAAAKDAAQAHAAAAQSPAPPGIPLAA